MYTVQATAAGFQVIQRENIQVLVGSDIRVDLTLQPGAQTQTVTVTGEAPAMNTTNAQTGGTLENSLVENLPVNGQSYRQITGVLPGVVMLPGSGTENQSTNGGGTDWDNYMLDGLYDVNPWANEATVGGITSSGDTTLLPLEAIQEINLVENPKAEYGYFPGVTVDVGLKSGTNDIHGSAWALGRDTAFDARNAFSTQRANVNFEQFGAVDGGPIVKNKVFYFVAYEGARIDAPAVFGTTAPTTADISGNATASIPEAIAGVNAKSGLNSNGVNVALNQLSVNLLGCNWNAPNNAIHSSSPATVATACASGNQYGSPSLFGNSGPSSAVTETLPDFGGSNQGLGKVDWKISEKHSFNAEFYMGDSSQQVPSAASNGATTVLTEPYWGVLYDVYTRTGRVVEIWTPNSNWLNEARVGYDFQDQPNYDAECGTGSTGGLQGAPNYLTSYNFTSGATALNGQQGCGFPTVSINGFQGELDATTDRLGGGRDLQFSDNVSYTRGSHQFKFGVNWRKECLCLESKNVDDAKGIIAFGTTGSAAFTGATPLEDFFAGMPASETILYAPSSLRDIHWNLIALFAQDDWRVKPRLTVNLGVRWEGETPARASDGELGNFDPNTPSGMTQSNELWPFQSAPSPHVGFAYDLTGKGTSVIRGGGSIAYVYQQMMYYTSLSNDSPQEMPTGATLYNPNGSSLKGPGTITTQVSVAKPLTSNSVISGNALPWTAGQPIFTSTSVLSQCGNGFPINGPGTTVTLANPLNPAQCNLYGSYPSWKLPYASTWNLSYEHAFNSNLTLNVAYVGTHGTDLQFEGDINQPTPGTSGSTNEEERRPFYTAANNAYGDNYPWFGKAIFNFNGGDSNYNGLQVTLTERPTHGLNFTAGYTYSHALGSTAASSIGSVTDLANLKQQYGYLPIDFENRFTLTTTYNIPGIKSPLQLLQGWSLVSNFLLMSNAALSVTDSVDDTSGTGTGLDFWNLYGNAKNLDQVIGGPGAVPCYAVAGSKFASNGCTIVAAGSTGALVGTAAYVANMPAACIAGAEAAANSPTSVPIMSTSSLSTSDGYNGLAQLAELGCYAYNGAAITPPSQGTFGTMHPGMLRPLASGGFKNWDLAVHKDWHVKERYTAEFRAEAFNFSNRTNYYTPVTVLGDNGTFGESQQTPDVGKGVTVTGLGGPREVQLGLKIIW